MKALITQREGVDKYGSAVDSLESNYIKYFEGLGYNLVPVSNYISSVDYLFEELPSLLILTGGGSLPGWCYEPVGSGVDSPCRDRIEKALFDKAIQLGVPVVAICRGMQYVNVLVGGRISVLSDLSVPRDIGKEHPIQWEKEILMVNNYHNDGIFLNQLADGLYPIAMDVDNDVVEGFISLEKRILGFQFHPERSISDLSSGEKIKNIILKNIK